MRKIPKSFYPYIGAIILLSPIISAFSGSQSTPSPSPSQQTASPAPTETQLATEDPAVSESPVPVATEEPIAEASELAGLLSQLTLAPERGEGYDRDLFRHWVDSDGDGCNTRREVLIAEAIEKPQVVGGCDLVGGKWYSVYDEVTTTDPGDFDVDHLIPLKEAWDSGAHSWTASQRRAFANDLGNPQALIAVTASSNRSKSDRDPADWLPPNQSFHCQYITDWMTIKIFWNLSVDEREFQALRRVATGC
jgi:hypothetical protein